jgi:hypothetical protein
MIAQQGTPQHGQALGNMGRLRLGSCLRLGKLKTTNLRRAIEHKFLRVGPSLKKNALSDSELNPYPRKSTSIPACELCNAKWYDRKSPVNHPSFGRRKGVLFCRKEPKDFYISATSSYPAMAGMPMLAHT